MKALTKSLLTLVTFLYISSSLGADPLNYYKLVYGWKQLDYKFQSDQTRSRLLSTKEFIPENNVITGIKVKGDKIFLTVPRWRPGVPATLVYVDYKQESPADEIVTESANGPLLQPFPSWEMNQLGNCNAFQYVQSMEIDPYGRMWVIDVGRVNIFTNETSNKCPPKLVIIDLEKGAEIIRRYEFPANVVSPTGNFLNDLALGCNSKDDCFAYITDALEGKIVVYNYGENRSWFVRHSSMLAVPKDQIINILGYNYTFNVAVDGIALAPKDFNFNRLYYSPLSSLDLFSVSTQRLKSAVNGITLEDSEVKNLGAKSSQSDGLLMDSKGILFYGLLDSNGVAYFNTSYNNLNGTNEVLLVQNDVDLQWPDTLAFDQTENLYTVSNRLQRFKENAYDYTEINFRVSRVYIGAKSYMFSAKEAMQEAMGQTISSADLDATPSSNLEIPMEPNSGNSHGQGHHDHPNNKYDTVPSDPYSSGNSKMSNHKEDNNNVNDDVPKSDSNKAEDVKNSSVKMDIYTGTLVFVLAVYVFHPVV